MRSRRSLRRILPIVGALLAAAGGCADRSGEFQPDTLLRLARGLSAERSASIDRVLVELLGDPERPRVPEGIEGVEGLFTSAALEECAGPVESHRPGHTRGLYRRHCARCHGVTGDGLGPTALYQSPAPRDFRRGVFKWKSTQRDAKPTLADLDRVLTHGVAGSSMPGFALIADHERDALRQYVVFLSVRGELERALIGLVSEEGNAAKPLDPRADATGVNELLRGIVAGWTDAPSAVVVAPQTADEAELAELVVRGREVYHSTKATCAKCHGQEGEGIAQQDVDYDDWTRERMTLRSEAERVAAKRDATEQRRFAEASADTRPASPAQGRRLVGMPLRGGDRPADLFARIQQGIAGTPMPAMGPSATKPGGVLNSDEIVAVAAYVRSLAKTSDATPRAEDASTPGGKR
ncbi:MAG: c-type cytochrome [Lacipirellulaceae bacterium]